MKIVDCEQGSDEWLQARLGIVTASELDSLITPLWKPRTGEGVQTYLATKIAERWRGQPLTDFHGGSMEQGSLREDEARAWYELDQNVTVRKVGFILSDDGKLGGSPDGLLEGGGIEIKCPEPHTHVRWLLDGELPKDHRAQVYGNMLVARAGWWKFMSYCRGFPPLIVTVEADPAIEKAIEEAVAAFQVKLDEAWAAIEKRNGGPPLRYQPVAEDPDYVFV